MEFRDEDYMLLLYKTELLFVAVFQAQSLRDSDVICVSNPVDFLYLKSAFGSTSAFAFDALIRTKKEPSRSGSFFAYEWYGGGLQTVS